MICTLALPPLCALLPPSSVFKVKIQRVLIRQKGHAHTKNTRSGSLTALYSAEAEEARNPIKSIHFSRAGPPPHKWNLSLKADRWLEIKDSRKVIERLSCVIYELWGEHS